MALAVVCVHVGVLARYTGIRAGHLAVDIFFLLSGFILTHVYDERRRSGRTSIAAFLLARVRRLLPQHILALGVVIAWTLALAAFGIESDWADDPLFHSDPVAAAGWLLWDLALLSNIIIPNIGGEPYWGLNGVTWSLSIELWVGPILLLVLGRAGRWPLVFAGVVAIAAFTAWLSLAVHAKTSALVFLNGGILQGVGSFLAGFLAYRAFSRISPVADRLSPRWWTVLEAGICLALFACLEGWFGNAHLQVLPVGLALLIVFAVGRGRISTLLRARPFQVLGAWSYPIYLWHGVILSMLVTFMARNFFLVVVGLMAVWLYRESRIPPLPAPAANARPTAT